MKALKERGSILQFVKMAMENFKLEKEDLLLYENIYSKYSKKIKKN